MGSLAISEALGVNHCESVDERCRKALSATTLVVRVLSSNADREIGGFHISLEPSDHARSSARSHWRTMGSQSTDCFQVAISEALGVNHCESVDERCRKALSATTLVESVPGFSLAVPLCRPRDWWISYLS
jgi:hypothetical protein